MTLATQSESVVVGTRVDTSKLPKDPAAASGRGRPAITLSEDPTPADPTKDADWAGYESAHQHSYVQDGPQSEAEREAIANLEGIFGGHPQPQTGPAGRAKKKAQEAPAEGTSRGQEASSEGGEESETEVPDEKELQRRTRAYAALQRDGWDEEDIQALNPERLVAIGLKRAKAQDDIDGKLNERRDERRTAKSEKGSSTPASGGPGQTEAHPLREVVAQSAEEFSRAITDQFGEEVGQATGGAFKSAMERLAGSISQRDQAVNETILGLGNMVEEMVLGAARKELVAEYPQAGEPKVWKAITDAYSMLRASGRYTGVEGALEHARRIVLPGVQPSSVARRHASEDQEYERKSGSRTSPSGRKQNTGPLTEEQKEYREYLRAEELSREAHANLVGGGF